MKFSHGLLAWVNVWGSIWLMGLPATQVRGEGTNTFVPAPCDLSRFDKGQDVDINPRCLDAVAVDVNGDTRLDLVAAIDEGRPNQVWTNSGSGFLVLSQTLSVPFGDRSSLGVAAADLNDDGACDLFFANVGGNRVWTNDGAGLFYNSGQNLGAADSRAVVLVDVDGDLDLDAAVANHGAANALWLNDGSGLFARAAIDLGAEASDDVAALDLDGDLAPELVFAGGGVSNRIAWNRAGTYTQSTFVVTHALARAVAIADVDANGFGDLLFAHDGGNSLWFNQGNRVFIESTQRLGQADSVDLAAGDIDGDGDIDHVAANANSQANTVWVNDGSGGFQVGQRLDIDPRSPLAGRHSRTVALADLDGDGDLDVFEGNVLQPNVTWFQACLRNLVLRQDVNTSAIEPDGRVQVAISIENVTGRMARDVVVSDRLPGGVGLVSCSSSCVASNDALLFALGDFAPGERRSLLLSVDVAPFVSGRQTNTAWVTSADGWTNMHGAAELAFDVPDTDRDGIADFADDDDDNDGLRDAWEIANGLDPLDATGSQGALGDGDGDSVNNTDEQSAGTHPAVKPAYEIPWTLVLGAQLGRSFDAAAFLGGMTFYDFDLQDVDGDHDLDAILLGQVSPGRDPTEDVQMLLRNIGNPRNPRWAVPESAGLPLTSTRSFADISHMADIDGDGDLDHFTLERFSLTLHENAGDARAAVWSRAREQYMGLVPLPGCMFTDAAFVDLDADGDLDLLLVEAVEADARSSRVVYTRNNGDAARAVFSSGQALNLGLETVLASVQRLAPGDLDGDGDVDLVFGGLYLADPAHALAHVENVGTVSNASWAAPALNWPIGHAGRVADAFDVFSFRDIDADRDLDFIYANRLGPVNFLENIGQATNAAWATPRRFSINLDVENNARLALGDLDADGDRDLVIGNWRGELCYHENVGSPNTPIWAEAITNYAGVRFGVGSDAIPALGDLDGDGDLDLVLGTVAEDLMWLENQGSPQAAAWGGAPVFLVNVAFFADTLVPVLHDIDADGDLDLFVGSLAGVDFIRNVGSSTAAAWAASQAAGADGFFASSPSPVLTDLDRDGNDDLVVAGQDLFSDASVRLRLYRNAGTPAAPDWQFETLLSPLEVSGLLYAPAFSDLDRDGDVDFMAADVLGGVHMLRNETPGLQVDPVNSTVGNGRQLALAVRGGTGPYQWGFGDNGSGATLASNTGDYVAGATAAVDVVEVADSTGLRGRAFINVINAADISSSGKALIVAGGKSLSDPVWEATDRLAQKAYRTLLLKGFAKTNIVYLSFQTGKDADGNGLFDDITGSATFDNVAQALSGGWAADAGNLFVYLVDHGTANATSNGFMRLNATEFLPASQLGVWLDGIQDTVGIPVTTVLDFCYAGAFLDEVVYTGAVPRVTFAATAGDQLTYFIADGLVSFSEIFFGALVQNMSAGQAFRMAKDAMSAYQVAWMDDTADGRYEPGVDGVVADTLRIGSNPRTGRDVPQIGAITPNLSMADAVDTITLFARDITSVYPVTRVWCVVVPPSHAPDLQSGDPVVDLPELDLFFNPLLDRYEAELGGLAEPGTYSVVYFAEDVWGGVSFPKQGVIHQGGFVDRAIVAVGGGVGGDRAEAYNTLGRLVYQTLRARRYGAEAIYYLNPRASQDLDGDGTNDVDAVTSVGQFANAVTNWAADADRLVIYCVGPGSNDTVNLGGQDVSATDFAGWVNAGAGTARVAYVILDFPGSEAFTPALATTAGTERIVIASAEPGRYSLAENGGAVSFSQYFLGQIFEGKTIGAAVTTARKTIRRVSGRLRQVAGIDDNGNGVVNEKNLDGQLADRRYLGSAFVTGEDVPAIGLAMPDTVLVGTNALTIFVENVTDADGISNVWVLVVEPDYDGQDALPRIELAPVPGASRYELNWDGFSREGLYLLNVNASDTRGHFAAPVIVAVTRVAAEPSTPDTFEVDDSATDASMFQRPQVHSLHVSNDVDWVRFYALSNFVYDIETQHHGTGIDTVLEVFFEQPDGTLTNIDRVDDFGVDEGEIAGLDFALEGWCYVRVSAYADAAFTPGGYTLIVDVPAGGGAFIVMAIDIVSGNALPVGTTLSIDGAPALSFNGQKTLQLDLPVGAHSLRVTPASGFRAVESTVQSGQVSNPFSEVYGNPRQVAAEDVAVGASGFAAFSFFPYAIAQGVVRDAHTGAWLQGVTLRFGATSGRLNGQSLDRFPHAATFAAPWATQSDGTFPTNMVLVARHHYSLQAQAGGYDPTGVVDAVANPPPGAVVDLGSLWLWPHDAETNGIADDWEERHFGRHVSGSTDDDGDGHDARSEYLAGTDPTNANDVLATDLQMGTSGFVVSFETRSGREYELLTTTTLFSEVWSRLIGPVTGRAENVWVKWTDTAGMTNRHYRVTIPRRPQ